MKVDCWTITGNKEGRKTMQMNHGGSVGLRGV